MSVSETMSINNVRKGDVIKEGNREIEVKRVDVNACSSRGTHVNNRYCWDSGYPVLVVQKSKDETLTDQDVQDGFILDEDALDEQLRNEIRADIAELMFV